MLFDEHLNSTADVICDDLPVAQKSAAFKDEFVFADPLSFVARNA